MPHHGPAGSAEWAIRRLQKPVAQPKASSIGYARPFRRHTERAVSSVVEHHLDMVGATGSNPVPRTIFLLVKMIPRCGAPAQHFASPLALMLISICLISGVMGKYSSSEWASRHQHLPVTMDSLL